jgi:hypothetical protein
MKVKNWYCIRHQGKGSIFKEGEKCKQCEREIETIKKEVREAIIAAVPEIMELKFGCRVRLKSSTENNVHIIIYSWETESGDRRYGIDGYVIADFKEKDFEILGRPITLADVLRAIDTDLAINDFGYFIRIVDCEVRDYYYGWDLSKPLDGQSDEVWRFLHSVLISKK